MEGAAAMSVLEFIERVDQDATLAINGLNSPVTDFIWQVFSNREIWIVMYLIVIVMLFVRLGWKKALTVVLYTILLITALDQTANLIAAIKAGKEYPKLVDGRVRQRLKLHQVG